MCKSILLLVSISVFHFTFLAFGGREESNIFIIPFFFSYFSIFIISFMRLRIILCSPKVEADRMQVNHLNPVKLGLQLY